MSSDLSKLSSADRASRLPSVAGSGSTGAATPSRGLVRVDPVDPHAGVPHVSDATSATPLGRSGLDLLDLLSTTDLVAQRARTGPVAMEVGLEQARATLLRNLPGEALALLDGVWDGAQRTEEGWYLRTSALNVLGLPGEADRVADAGLAQRPHSLALRFMQSIARVALGDLSGARAALQPALAQAPRDPLLTVQHALVHASRGDTRGAEQLLAMLESTAPMHPVVKWGRAALRALIADARRSQSVTSRSESGSVVADAPLVDDIFGPVARDGDGDEEAADVIVGDVNMRDPASSDVAASALAKFGARIALRPEPELAREARMLMRAFSAGGSLVSATRPEQAHAARIVLATFLSAITHERVDTPAPIRSVIEQVIPLLRSVHAGDAERLVQRQGLFAREPIGRLLLAVVRGAIVARGGTVLSETSARLTPNGSPIFERDGTPANGAAAIGREVERGALVPVRLGLALLHETRATRTTPAPGTVTRTADRSLTPVTTLSGLDDAQAGWSFARAVADSVSPTWPPIVSARGVAIVAVVLAVAAIATGHSVAAVVIAACAIWIGFTPRGDREPHEPPTQ